MSATSSGSVRNPFRIHGTVRGDDFTDREEVTRFERTLLEPGAKLLVYGLQRMGKTSALERAVDRVNAGGGHAVLADLSTASALTDMVNRILTATSGALGRSVGDFVRWAAPRAPPRTCAVWA